MSSCQISSKSVERLQRYGNLTVFKMVAVRHLGFVKSKVFKGRGSYETHFASAYQISQRSVKPLHGYRNFCDFQDGGRRHFGFSKIRNFNISSAVRGQYVSSCQISSKLVKQLQRYGNLPFLLNGGRPPSWICWAPIGATYDDRLVVSIVMQNLVQIDAVVSTA